MHEDIASGPSRALESHPRLRVEVHFRPGTRSTLKEDARHGLSARPKTLPPKYLYDARGSALFDAICDTPEYYPTRTEAALLRAVADDIVQSVRPREIVELGSGAARKTRVLLDAAARADLRPIYVPFDVSESMLRESAAALLREYPWLHVHGIVGDYERHLEHIPRGNRRLILFIGSTIGNFEDEAAVTFLRRIRERMGDDDRLLLGTDLVKDRRVLDAAYNDAEGITAAFNENLLRVLNRELGARFDEEAFEHRAFFNEAESQIEMHLRSKRAQTVKVDALGLTVAFREGETIRTEISRKFTRPSVDRLLRRAGLLLTEWYAPDDDYFALSLARPAG